MIAIHKDTIISDMYYYNVTFISYSNCKIFCLGILNYRFFFCEKGTLAYEFLFSMFYFQISKNTFASVSIRSERSATLGKGNKRKVRKPH